MRAVRRGTPPPALGTLLGVEPERAWSSDGESATHAAIRNELRHAQHMACAYCEQPIPHAGQVEHIHPKSLPGCAIRFSPNPNYDWGNMLLVCGSPVHCDGPKKDLHLCGSILFPDEMVEGQPYCSVNSYTGRIAARSDLDPTLRNLLQNAIDRLKLNDPELKRMRLTVIRMIQTELEASGDLALARHKASITGGFLSTVEAYLDRC